MDVVRGAQNGPDQFIMVSTAELRFVELILFCKKMEVAKQSNVQLDITERLWEVITVICAKSSLDQTLFKLVACKTSVPTIRFG